MIIVSPELAASLKQSSETIQALPGLSAARRMPGFSALSEQSGKASAKIDKASQDDAATSDARPAKTG